MEQKMEQGEASVTRHRTNEQNVRNAAAVAVVAAGAPPQVEQIADILKLDIDCFEELFDYSRRGNLISVGKTCKRLQNVAGYLFRLNYSETDIFCEQFGILTDANFSWFKKFPYGNPADWDMTHLLPSIQKITIVSRDGLDIVFRLKSQFLRLKQVTIKKVAICEQDIGRLAEIWSKLEVLNIHECGRDLNYRAITDLCQNLKRLQIRDCDTNYDWLARKYPTLEYLNLIPRGDDYIDGLMTIFELNPNIRKLATSAECLSQHRHIMKNVQLDELAITCVERRRDFDFNSFFQLLIELYERGMYKRLQMHFPGIAPEPAKRQLTMLNGLVQLSIKYCIENLSSLKSLEDLTICDVWFDHIIVESAARELTNLKRFHTEKACLNDILPFINHAAALEKVRVDRFRGNKVLKVVCRGACPHKIYDEINYIDLPTLNRLRQQLPNARKITLFVEERVYLASKWRFTETNLDLIRLQRLESFDWGHDFDKSRGF